MTKNKAIRRVKEHLTRYAPELLPILVVAWADIPEEADEQACAIYHVSWEVPLDESDAAIIIFDQDNWKNLNNAEQEDLIDHETAHLLAGFSTHKDTVAKHGRAWTEWYGRLRAPESE